MSAKSRVPRRTLKHVAKFLLGRGWTEQSDGLWTHPVCSSPWPSGDAERLELESDVPLSKREHPFAETPIVVARGAHRMDGGS